MRDGEVSSGNDDSGEEDRERDGHDQPSSDESDRGSAPRNPAAAGHAGGRGSGSGEVDISRSANPQGRSGRDPADPPANHRLISYREEVSEEQQALWVAPMPTPEVMRQYEEVLPGSAQRILDMAVTVSTGEIEAQKTLAEASAASMKEEVELAKTGQAIAGLIALLFTGAGIALLFLGHWFGVFGLLGGGAALVGPFLKRDRAPDKAS